MTLNQIVDELVARMDRDEISQSELARRTRAAFTTVNKFCQGKVSDRTTFDFVERAADALGYELQLKRKGRGRR